MPDPRGGNGHDGSDLRMSSKEFDHHNHERMDRHFLPTVNNELVLEGYIPSKEIPMVKHQIRELAYLAKINAGNDKGATVSWEIESMIWTADRMVDHARDGFGVRMGNTYIEEQSLRVNGGGQKKSRFNIFRRGNQEQQPPVAVNIER
jgi:hypothetical protein